MNVICPHCNSRLTLAALTEDAAARKLFGLLAGCGTAGSALIAYLGLFKPPKQALRWARAYRLAEETVAMSRQAEATSDQLATACMRTVSALGERRKGSDWQPLSNHRYLARVLDAVLQEAPSQPGSLQTARSPFTTGPRSKRLAALEVLDED